MEYYVYTLTDPRTQKIFYVGKGHKNRMYVHYNRVKNNRKFKNKHLFYKLRQLICENLEPIYNKIFCCNDEDLAYNKEIEIIQSIGLKNLCNILPGGGGNAYWKNKKLSDSHKDKIKHSALRGKDNPFFGKTHSDVARKLISERTKAALDNPEVRLKMRIYAKNRPPMSDETKIKIGNASRGRKLSLETKKLMSNSKRGIPKSAEHKRKLHASCTGWKHSPEAIEKIRKSSTGRKLSIEARKKISDSAKKRKKRVISPETRKKQSIASALAWKRKRELLESK